MTANARPPEDRATGAAGATGAKERPGDRKRLGRVLPSLLPYWKFVAFGAGLVPVNTGAQPAGPQPTRIAMQGTHDELLAEGGLYAAMYRRQMLEEELSRL